MDHPHIAIYVDALGRIFREYDRDAANCTIFLKLGMLLREGETLCNGNSDLQRSINKLKVYADALARMKDTNDRNDAAFNDLITQAESEIRQWQSYATNFPPPDEL